MSTSEINTIPTKLKMEEKPARLVRTSSIEKIRRFNSFICSQHYFILPALISWLKSSQVALHSQYEQKIYFFKSLIFNTYFYKLFLQNCKNVTTTKAAQIQQVHLNHIQVLVSNFFSTFSKSFESTFVLKVAVYLASLFIVVQLLFCIYLLALIHIPNGLYFLISCLLYINYIGFKLEYCKRDIKHKKF